MPPPPSERTALLTGENGHAPRQSFVQRALAVIEAKDEPSWGKSLRFFFLGSYLNVLLLFVPLSAVAHYLNWDAALRFSFSFIAIIPLAKVCVLRRRAFMVSPVLQLLGEATEQMSFKLGQTLAGLLNASFGNAVEIIVGVAALLKGTSLWQLASATLISQLDELVIVQNSVRGCSSPNHLSELNGATDVGLHSVEYSPRTRLLVPGWYALVLGISEAVSEECLSWRC